MTNEEIQEIVAKAEDNYERLKDRVHEQYDEIKRLNNIINKAIEYIEIIQYNESYGVKEKDYLKLLDILQGSDKK